MLSFYSFHQPDSPSTGVLITIISPLTANYFIHECYTLSVLLLLGNQLPKGRKEAKKKGTKDVNNSPHGNGGLEDKILIPYTLLYNLN